MGYLTLGRKGVIREINITGARLLANDRALIVNVPFSQFVRKEDVRTFLSHLSQVFESDDKQTCEIRIRTNDGEAFVRLESISVKEPEGTRSFCRTALTDLSDRKRGEEALQHSEDLFRSICESAEDIIFIRDLSHRIVYANPAAEKLLGISLSSLIGKRWDYDFEPGSSEYGKDLNERVLAGAIVEEQHRWTINGAQRDFLETRIPMRDRSGKINRILLVARDITDRKRTETSADKGKSEYVSKAMRQTLRLADVAAQKNSIVLLLGESGSGKDYLARHIHDHSPRSDGVHLSVNCAAIAPELAESELFGHEKGAFTGAVSKKRGLLELAEGGTLLLNEVGELSLSLQAKLLTFLDSRKFSRVGGEKEIRANARLIAATNKDLEVEVKAGRFRQDLFYRLNVFPIKVPPLRERREDIPIILRELLVKLRKGLPVPPNFDLDPSFLEEAMVYDWPGNVRELRNALERAVVVSGYENITMKGIGLTAPDPEQQEWCFTARFTEGQSLNAISANLKRAFIEEALRRSLGRRQEAAGLLGISRYSLKHYMKSLDIPDEE